MSVGHHHHHHHEIEDEESERKTRIVVIVTLVTMVIEIYAGIVTKTIDLLEDGWHMGTKAGDLSNTQYAKNNDIIYKVIEPNKKRFVIKSYAEIFTNN